MAFMCYTIKLILLILICLNPFSLLANEQFGGLIFRSYESSKEDRTYFLIPADKTPRVSYHNYLSLSFDLKIREGGEPFGYICRIAIGNTDNLDLLLTNPVNQNPYFCLVKKQQYLGKLPSINIDNFYQWHTIHLELEITNHILYIKEKGQIIAQEKATEKPQSIQICFGANNLSNTSTSDVAPMIVKNIRLKTEKNKNEYYWSLKQPSQTPLLKSENGDIVAQVYNPEWVSTLHQHWKFIRGVSFSSKSFPVSDVQQGILYFVSNDRITQINLISNKMEIHKFQPPIEIERMSNQFITLPYDSVNKKNRLAYYDFEKEDKDVLTFFDFENNTWSKCITRERQSIYNQHNKFYSPTDSCIVQLFGYGFHQYSSELNKVSLSGKVMRKQLKGIIPPRYLSSIGNTDSSLYIYGGLGNETGKQEYGVKTYHDLYKLNLKDYSVNKLWRNDTTKTNCEVATSTLLIDETNQRAYGLFFNPHRYHSSLVLKALHLQTGEIEVLGDTIPYLFQDISSYADLIYLPQQQKYYAVTVYQTEEHTYEAKLYSISAPVFSSYISTTDFSNGCSLSTSILIICIISVGVGIFYIIRRQKRHNKSVITTEMLTASIIQTDTPSPNETNITVNDNLPNEEITETRTIQPGIYLLNGFQVINRELEDITGKFTPIMRQLLSAILLYSNQYNKGISNTRLKELFWYDKSEESFSNNRSVNIRKIRILLKEIGNADISVVNGYWHFVNEGEIYIDYFTALKLLEKYSQSNYIRPDDLQLLLRLATQGQLLPNLQFEWVDEFKSDYSDGMISLLSKLRDSTQSDINDNIRIELANSILKYDSLDEESIRVKCQALLRLKRTGIAYMTYKQFVKEYKQILDSDFEESFETFIHEK